MKAFEIMEACIEDQPFSPLPSFYGPNKGVKLDGYTPKKPTGT